MNKDVRDVWIMGAYGNGNVGDDMLGDVVRRTLDAHGCSVRVLAGDFFPFPRFAGHGRKTVIRHVCAGDSVIFAGGGLLNDHFGLGFLRRFSSLGLALRLRGAHYAFSGIGVEGFESTQGRLLGRLAMSLADSVSVRDSPSAANVAALGRTATTIPDLGWLARRHLEPPSANSERTKVVLSIAVEHESRRNEREDVVHTAAAEVLRHTTKDVVLVAMQTSSIAALNDVVSMERIRSALGSERVSVLTPTSYQDLYPVLTAASVVGGYRLHAAVLGLVAGSRVVAVSRSHKVREALKDFPQSHVIDESELASGSMSAFGSALIAADSRSAVKLSDLERIDIYCDAIEADLIPLAVGLN